MGEGGEGQVVGEIAGFAVFGGGVRAGGHVGGGREDNWTSGCWSVGCEDTLQSSCREDRDS